MKRRKIVLFWSGGKDSALSLFELKSPEWQITGLVSCFIQSSSPRSQTHELSIELVRAQSLSLELPLFEIFLPENPSNEIYEAKIGEKMKELKAQGVVAAAFGDIHLQDIRDYREKLFKSLEMECVFPLWGWKQEMILQAFAGLGHQALVHCIQKDKLPPAFLGRAYNASFIEDLPMGVDAAGENGEFHTFVYDGPFFQKKIGFSFGELYEKSEHLYKEILLKDERNERHN